MVSTYFRLFEIYLTFIALDLGNKIRHAVNCLKIKLVIKLYGELLLTLPPPWILTISVADFYKHDTRKE